MSKADLRAAMEMLQVKTPLRLKGERPTFKAPPAPVTQESSTSEDRLVSQDVPSSGDTVASQEVFPSTDVPPAVVPRSSQPRRATRQDGAVTEARAVKSRLSTGYTRVPNTLLMEMVSGDLTRNEMKLLLLIARMTISFNRAHVPLSKGVIERMTGIQGRSVLEALQSLVRANFIEKLPGDCNSPNRLGLAANMAFVETASQVPKTPLDASGARDAKGSPEWDANGTYKKDSIETIDLRKKISLSTLPEPLRGYFSDLKPRRKRETEFEAFEDLRVDYRESDIAECLSFLLQRGIPHSGASCHSPMAYLSKAIGQVLTEVTALKQRERAIQEKQNRQIEEQRQLREQEKAEEAEIAKREEVFKRRYPNPKHQARVFRIFAAQVPHFSSNGPIARNLAMAAWWRQFSSKSRRGRT